MRIVRGDEITIKELKDCTFGYDEDVPWCELVEIIEYENYVFTIDENVEFYIQYALDRPQYSPAPPHVFHEDILNMSPYDFIKKYICIDRQPDWENFIYYFAD